MTKLTWKHYFKILKITYYMETLVLSCKLKLSNQIDGYFFEVNNDVSKLGLMILSK